jgi:hypothetical protein
MAGLPVIGHDAALLQHRIGFEQPVDFTSTTNFAFGCARKDRAPAARRSCRRRFRALVVDHAAAVAVAVEAQADIGALCARTASAIACSMCMSSGLGLYLGKV